MVSAGLSIDELFRQKSLQEIHAELRSTREEVEAKKRELRELVGDHYRSVLESSDHIRAMSDCASKVSTGAERIDELIASMRTLAANPPPFVVPTASGSPTPASPTSPMSAGDAPGKPGASEDFDFLIGKLVMELIEIPDTVREHLGELEFVRAARVALVDAAALREKVDALLQAPGRAAEPGCAGKPPAFDYATLVGQQTATFRGLPRQIGACCLDAFAAAALRPAGAAQGFVVHLLLEPLAQPVPLLSSFLDRRSELLRGLLDSPADSGLGGCAVRLAEAAMAFEGTVLLSSCLCRSAAGGAPAQLIAALDAVAASTGGGGAAEERAAIEGRTLNAGDVGAFRRRADDLRAQLQQGGAAAMAARLAEVGGALAQEWSPQGPPHAGAAGHGDAGGRALRTRFARLVAAASDGGQLSSCQALSEVLAMCKERVLAYREELTGGPPEAWGLAWREACGQFCPGRAGPLDDALAIVSATVEKAAAGIVGERVAELRLQLVLEEDGSAAAAAAASGRGAGGGAAALADGGEARRREETAEFQRQARSAVSAYDERLGDVMTDVAYIARSGEAPAAVSRALLAALQDRLREACEQVPLPAAPAHWPPARAAEAGASGTHTASWQLQRNAARAAIAMDALLSVASDSKGAGDVGKSNLHQTLDAALSSGVPDMAAQAQDILSSLRHHSSQAYCVWARLGVLPVGCAATLTSFWRLADDEVAPACGWGSARFAPKAGDLGSDAAKAVPIPVQASPFVMERVALGARQAAEVSSSTGSMPHALVTAVKMALSELFMSAYDAEPLDLEAIKRTGMSHLLQFLFDLRFLRIALAAGPAPGASPGAKVENSAAYEALRALLERAEAATLLDPVDRLLYQETLKSSVKSHVEGVKVLLAPFFLYNPLYGFLLQPSQTRADQGACGLGGDEAAGFEIQAAMAAPLRPVLPRFPLLPVAMASTLAYTSSTDLDARLGLSAEAMDRAAARAAAASGGVGAPGSGLGWMRDASSLVGSGLGSLGIGKALGGNWTTGLGFQGGSAKPPEAV